MANKSSVNDSIWINTPKSVSFTIKCVYSDAVDKDRVNFSICNIYTQLRITLTICYCIKALMEENKFFIKH